MHFASTTMKLRLCFLLFVFAAASLIAESGEAAMDRSGARIGASVQQYANYLYLSELFGTPTSLPFYNRFCGDIFNDDQLQELVGNIHNIVQRDYWTPTCLPVGVSIDRKKTTGGAFNVRLRYLKLAEPSRWIEQFKAAVESDPIDDSALIPPDRQYNSLSSTNCPTIYFSPMGNVSL